MVNNSDSKPKTGRGSPKRARPGDDGASVADNDNLIPSPVPPAAPTTVAPEAAPVGPDQYDDDEPQDTYDYAERLALGLSRSLHRKVVQLSRDEGMTVEDFVSELVAEGVVIRAWEIAERKSAMRGGPPGNYPNSNNRQGQSQGMPQRNNGGGGPPSGGHRKGGYRGMSQNRYQNIMEDKATFLEYVRNQERNRK